MVFQINNTYTIMLTADVPIQLKKNCLRKMCLFSW